MQYIEGGWPGANPKDEEFFRRAAAGELHLRPRHPGGVRLDPQGRRPGRDRPGARRSARRPDGRGLPGRQVGRAATSPRPCARRSPRPSTWWPTRSATCVGQGRRVFLDAEHFFDGYRTNPGFSLDVLRAAAAAGAEVLVLCDTNGGTPALRGGARGRRGPRRWSDVTLGCHFHNDSGCAVANSLVAVRHGRAPRCRAASTATASAPATPTSDAAVPDLTLKMGVRTIGADRLERLTAGVPPHRRAGQHRPRPAPAVRRASPPSPTRPGCTPVPSPGPATPTSTSTPDSVGNGTRFVVSEMAGRSTVAAQGRASSASTSTTPCLADVVEKLKAPRAPRLPLRGRRRLARAADAGGHRVEAALLPAGVASGSSPSSARTAPS